MQKARKLYLVGIGYRPLCEKAREAVQDAAVVFASSRLLDVFMRYEEYSSLKDRIRVADSVPQTISCIADELAAAARGNIVLLASGDPLFFGIGRRIINEFGKDRVEIIPDLSSMQEAFARINVPWDDAFLISVHGGPDIAKRRALPYEVSDIPWLLKKHGKIAVLTDRQNNPAAIAKEIRNSSSDHGSSTAVFVCERLGYPDERTWEGTIAEAAGMTFSEPNVMILLRTDETKRIIEPVFGLQEKEFEHRDAMITKDEVRAVTIHKLRLPMKGLLWDIGAGSGAVAIEAARLSPGLSVAAVERDQEQVDKIRANKMQFDVRNLRIIHGAAPEALADMDAPDRVFIGGSGGRLADIVAYAGSRMKSGIIVINAVTLDTLQEGMSALERVGFATDVCEVQLSRLKKTGGKKMMSALNPVFILSGERR